uniref:Uncharacterized protein n=1 Tax=Homalodisca liturata TaxID=320908 RepID=A0A1B6ICX3_9HEMI
MFEENELNMKPQKKKEDYTVNMKTQGVSESNDESQPNNYNCDKSNGVHSKDLIPGTATYNDEVHNGNVLPPETGNSIGISDTQISQSHLDPVGNNFNQPRSDLEEIHDIYREQQQLQHGGNYVYQPQLYPKRIYDTYRRQPQLHPTDSDSYFNQPRSVNAGYFHTHRTQPQLQHTDNDLYQPQPYSIIMHDSYRGNLNVDSTGSFINESSSYPTGMNSTHRGHLHLENNFNQSISYSLSQNYSLAILSDLISSEFMKLLKHHHGHDLNMILPQYITHIEDTHS